MPQDSIEIVIDNQTLRPTVRKNGDATWDVSPDQIEPHLAGIERTDHPWAPMRKGDRSTLQDAASDDRRRRRQDERNR